MDAIIVNNLTKRYTSTLAVDDISFTLPQGGVLGLLGGNGAGKTTTISMLLGLLVPTSGSITVLGHNMAKDRFAALARMNFSSPYIALPQKLTVLENLRVYGNLYNVKNIARRIAELSENSTWASSSAAPPANYPPARKPASHLPNPSSTNPTSCSSTNPPPAWTRTPEISCAPPRTLRQGDQRRDPAGLAQHGRGGAALR